MTRPACIHCGRGLIWRAGMRSWVHERNASAWCDSPGGTIAEVTGKGDGRREAERVRYNLAEKWGRAR